MRPVKTGNTSPLLNNGISFAYGLNERQALNSCFHNGYDECKNHKTVGKLKVALVIQLFLSYVISKPRFVVHKTMLDTTQVQVD